MNTTRKEREYQEKIHHYYISLKRCIQNLIALNKLSTTAKLDVIRLRQMLEMLNGVIKER